VERINPPGLARPSGFSHAVSVRADRLVFLAGQTGHDADGRIVPGGVEAQFEQALRNLLVALAAAGGQAADLVSMTIYVVNIDDYRAHSKEIGAAWRRLAGSDYPAMAAVEISRLWDPAAVVELQGIAATASLSP
jgi:enamine deaminase RidA (YjgF/YER057c/UK114 family)